MIRNLVLAGALALAAAVPAGATTVVTQTGFGPGASAFGAFDLSSYLADAEGRTFTITAATLTARAYSAPTYAPPVITTVNTTQGFDVITIDPLTIRLNVLRERTITFVDAVADSLTLTAGPFASQSVSGTVSEVLDTLDVIDQGATDGPIESFIPGVPGAPFPGTQHTTLQDRIVHRAIYGSLELALNFDAGNLQFANLGVASFRITPGLGGFPGFDEFLNPSQFEIQSVSLAFDRVQTSGPPLPVPEPGVWALMILGFGLAGARLRRQVRAVA